MAKMVEVKLIGLFCDFADEQGKDLEITGSFTAITFDDNPFVQKSSHVIFDFPDGPIRIAQGQFVRIDRDVRVSMSTPPFDASPNPFGFFVKFGGVLIEKDEPDNPDDSQGGGTWKTLGSDEVTSPLGEAQSHRLRFENLDQQIRADFTVTFVHHL